MNFQPAEVILIDGTLILHSSQIRNHLDFSIFLHASRETRFQRRLLRDTNERGRTIEGVVAQFEKQVEPMNIAFVEPSSQHANLELQENEVTPEIIKIIESKIKNLNN